MAGQKPLAQRMQETMERIWKYGNIRVDRTDKDVLKRLIKQGKVKITQYRYGGRKSTAVLVSLIPAPVKEEKSDTGGPFAKRRAALDEAEIHYRGKNLGREKVVGERRLTKQQKKKLEQKQVWEKLKT
jgi:hypothetical protein